MRPQTFLHSLRKRLGNEYRLRWSVKRHVWMIEQRCGQEVTLPVELGDDRAQRIKDGYTLVMEFYAQPTIGCPVCERALRVPFGKIGELTCPDCLRNPDVERFSLYIGHFPFCDKLLDHLERTALKRHDAWRREMDAKNAAIAAQIQRKRDNHIEAVCSDYFNRAVGILQTGYTAPGSAHAYGR